jgi:hypothetical protein
VSSNANLLTEVRRQIRTRHDALAKFVRCLENERARGVVVPSAANFDTVRLPPHHSPSVTISSCGDAGVPLVAQLGSLLLVALDVLDQRSDFALAKSIMVISQTFYMHSTPDGALCCRAALRRGRRSHSHRHGACVWACDDAGRWRSSSVHIAELTPEADVTPGEP